MGTSVSLDTLKVKHFKVLKVLKKVVGNLKNGGRFLTRNPKLKPAAQAVGFGTSFGRSGPLKIYKPIFCNFKKDSFLGRPARG